MNIREAHPYTEMLLHAMLAEHDKGDYHTDIIGTIDNFYPVMDKFEILEDDVDLAYIMVVPGMILLSISGTRDEDGWGRNAKFIPVNGWHMGFKESFDRLIKNPLIEILRKYQYPIKITGHSAGPAIGLNAAYYIRTHYNRDCELIGFCCPQAVDKTGVVQCRKAKVCATLLNVGRHDQVDNIGKIVGGKNYGYVVELPDAGNPGLNRFKLVDRIFYGHAPSYVIRCMSKMYHDWGRSEEQGYLDKIAYLAVK